ncbi:MAG: hypothetical protein K8T10_16200 [Candidatus Eremiobacteraeota bacterium]|nr:hypothetical protein [Candidatus Eremiobacteraeota bacterium]
MSKKQKTEEKEMVDPRTIDVQVGRTWQAPNPLRVDNRDPNSSYRWVRKDKIEQKRYEGWKPVERDNGPEKYASPDGSQTDNNYHYRELVLCKMPRDMAEQRNQHYRDKGTKALAAAKTRFRNEASRAGVELIEDR